MLGIPEHTWPESLNSVPIRNSSGLTGCKKSWESNISFLRYCRFIILDILGVAKTSMH